MRVDLLDNGFPQLQETEYSLPEAREVLVAGQRILEESADKKINDRHYQGARSIFRFALEAIAMLDADAGELAGLPGDTEPIRVRVRELTEYAFMAHGDELRLMGDTATLPGHARHLANTAIEHAIFSAMNHEQSI